MLTQDRVITGLKALTEEYTERFAPASLFERFLVETLAISEWRSRQYMRTADSAQREFSSALKQLMALQAKRAPVPQSSGLFLVPKR